MLSNISTPLLGMVDTAVVGHLDHAYYIGAVAVGSIVFSFLFWGFGFLRMGTTALTAQALGAEDGDEVRATLARALALAALLGLLLIGLQAPIGIGAFGLLDASADVERYARLYFEIRIWGAPAALGNYVILGWLLGTQRPVHALALQLLLNGLNIVLNLALVLGLGYGVAGVALATALSEGVALAVGLLLVARILRGLGGTWQPGLILDWPSLRRLMQVNRDIFLRTLCLVAAFAWFTNRGAAMGDVILAANAVLMNFQLFMSYALDGFAHAAESLVGGTVGAKDRKGLSQVVRASTIWAAIVASVFALAYLAGGGVLIDILTGIESVRQEARRYLPWNVLLPLISVWSFQFDGIFIGATRTGAMRNAMIVSLAAFLAAAWLFVPALGNHGLWLAFALFMAMRGVTLALAYPGLLRSVPSGPSERPA